jgi:hypothetical protein
MPAVYPQNVRPFPDRENCDYNDRGFTCRVPPGHYFMMGDNRDNSDDSRYWGFVPDDHIRGKAFFIWFNWDDISSFAFKRVGSGIRLRREATASAAQTARSFDHRVPVRGGRAHHLRDVGFRVLPSYIEYYSRSRGAREVARDHANIRSRTSASLDSRISADYVDSVRASGLR